MAFCCRLFRTQTFTIYHLKKQSVREQKFFLSKNSIQQERACDNCVKIVSLGLTDLNALKNVICESSGAKAHPEAVEVCSLEKDPFPNKKNPTTCSKVWSFNFKSSSSTGFFPKNSPASE